MFLNYASYFQTEEHKLHSIVDSVLNEIMPDGGFNCRTTRTGAKHSSLHTTLSVLEGIIEFQFANYTYRKNELQKTRESAEEFILLHQLYLSDRTGKIIQKDFLMMPYPCRWKYNILRAMDYFRYAEREWDVRMEPAMHVLIQKRNKNRSWNLQTAHPGQVHFEMEKVGKPSRWNTLRVMRVLHQFKNTFHAEV